MREKKIDNSLITEKLWQVWTFPFLHSLGRFTRRGHLCHHRLATNSPVQKLHVQSLSVKKPKLFNCIPKDIWNMTCCPADEFKSKLDTFLDGLEDTPFISGSTDSPNAQNDNSLLSVISLSRLRQQGHSRCTSTKWAINARSLTKVTKVR